MGRFSPAELLIILAVILVLFGGKKLPELARGLGEGLREFKQATKEGASEEKSEESKS